MDDNIWKMDLSKIDFDKFFKPAPFNYIEPYNHTLNPYIFKEHSGLDRSFDFSKKILEFDPKEFQRMINGIYHGTSLEALDHILEEGVMRTARELLKRKRLVYGELFEEMQRENCFEQKGPKFMSRRGMVEMGMI